MSFLTKRRMQDGQRKNGLNDPEENCGVKPVESQLNYNAQDCQLMNMPMPMNDDNYYVASVPMSQKGQHHRATMNLERGQQHRKGTAATAGEGDQFDVIQAEKMANVINYPPSWSRSGCYEETPKRAATAQTVDSPDVLATSVDGGSNAVMTLPDGSYYDTPVYIDPMTYQQQHSNSINAATTAATNFAFPNLAQQSHNQQQQQQQQQQQLSRCSNVNCMNCKR